ncbi:ComF family protein [Lysobacter pythonis]|uniref:ComF family protein n=2 Tax=Solilutibacter pythonis TaxID=2483112 RepID=A0A3M2HVL0_9GAMM|nr:ComF family protein [Lysobacter pythonis]RMH93766.1 ComF family protein [Lysobacter pythonis]
MPIPVNFPIRRLVDGLARRLWPPVCLACCGGGDTGAGRDLCPACFAALPWHRHACAGCALPLAAADTGARCGACLIRRDAPLAEVRAVFAYTAPLDRLLPRFKFHQSLAAGRLLSSLMVSGLADAALSSADTVLIPVPLHRRRLAARGHDQALELARPLARALGLPLRHDLLWRCKHTGAQSRLDQATRRRNLRDAFRVRGGAAPARVTLIDDVMTTGATLEAAARALRQAGVARVDAWVCARAA